MPGWVPLAGALVRIEVFRWTPHSSASDVPNLRTEEGKPMGLAGPGMLSRRAFINGTIGAGVALAAQGARTAKAQMNTGKRTIVDA